MTRRATPPLNDVPPTIAVTSDPSQEPLLHQAASRLAAVLGQPLIGPDTDGYEIVVAVTPQRLEVRWTSGGRLPVYVDMERLDVGSNAGGRLSQPLARAIGVKPANPLWVIDATAGLGEDAWLTASWGCRVTAIERCPIVAALLGDGLERARNTNPVVAARIQLVEADTRQWLNSLSANAKPDVIYLDPMFPPRSKTVTAKKGIRLLRRLVGDDLDVPALADLAIQVAQKRVVIKRSLRAQPLLGDPTFSKKGKAVRYDVYAVHGSQQSP